MRRKSLLIALVCGAVALAVAPAALGGVRWQGPRGYLLVTFSGSGGGQYSFHAPADAAGAACHQPDTGYDETDSYAWSYSFLVPPTGGSGGPPVELAGAGQVSGSEQTARCGGAAAAATTCTLQLRSPLPADSGDLAYPDVNVVASGRQVTIGALGELVDDGAGTCTGPGTLVSNPVPGYSQLQASVTFPRALLFRPGGYRGAFTMSGAGLYDNIALSGQCNAAGCDTANCAVDLPGGGAASSCSFDEDYSGTIYVRVLR